MDRDDRDKAGTEKSLHPPELPFQRVAQRSLDVPGAPASSALIFRVIQSGIPGKVCVPKYMRQGLQPPHPLAQGLRAHSLHLHCRSTPVQ